MAERPAASRRQAYRRGHRSEWLAAAALMVKGYRILARRHRTRFGEIDLIARRGDLVLIVEVKARRTLMEAMEAVRYESERRIESAANRLIVEAAHSSNPPPIAPEVLARAEQASATH